MTYSVDATYAANARTVAHVSNRKRKPQPRRQPRPDDNLAPEQFPDLNRQFYSGKLQPRDYLMHRYRSLFLAAQPPEVLPCAYDRSLSIGELESTWASPDEWDDGEVRDYLSTESTVLLHHTAEALLRLYFAHIDSPECPWLGVARMRKPSEFKERLASFIDSGADAVEASEMLVFYGHNAPPEGQQEHWEDLRLGLRSLLRHLGRRLLDEADLYNSAKHGLSLVPGAAQMEFGDQDGPLPIRASGPSITYLTVKDGEKGKRWAQETTWLNPARTLAVVALALYQMSNLWHVARFRYTGEAYDPSEIHFMTSNVVSQVLHPPVEGVKITVPSMAMGLLYHEDKPPAGSNQQR